MTEHVADRSALPPPSSSPPPDAARRPIGIVLAFLLFCGFVWLVFAMLGDNINYFKTPSDVTLTDRQEGKPMRLGGVVVPGSITPKEDEMIFAIGDGIMRETIRFHGVLPDLFREGQGVVVEGRFVGGAFVAVRVLAKHDENYSATAPTRPSSLMNE